MTYMYNKRFRQHATPKRVAGKSFLAMLTVLLGASAMQLPYVGAAGDLKTGFVPGKSFCNSFTVDNLTSDGIACITLNQNSTAKDDVETMLFFTNNSSAKANVTTTLKVNGALQPGSTSATFNPGLPTRTGWKTTATVAFPSDQVEAVFTLNGQVIDSVSGQL